MALTETLRFSFTVDTLEGAPQKFGLADVVFDASYPTGGEVITPSDYGMTKVQAMIKVYDDDKYIYNFDMANQKLMVLYGNYDSADGPLIEVPDTTNLSGLNAVFLVIGY